MQIANHFSADRIQQADSIYSAFNTGRLAFREVTAIKEAYYLNQPTKYPRPVYTVKRGVPVHMRPSNSGTIAIIDPKPLCAYKRNAYTHMLDVANKHPDDLEVKCLPDLSSLLTKMEEQADRKHWEVYHPSSSGHLKADGLFTLPKTTSKNHTRLDRLDHSELVTVAYEKSQIVCFCASHRESRLSEILKQKQELEKDMELSSLPIAIYSSVQGQIQILFEEDLPSAESLEADEALLFNYAQSISVQSWNLDDTLLLLTWPEKVHFLRELRKRFQLTPPGTPTIEELLTLVSEPESYNAELLKQYFDRGAQLNVPIFHQGRPQSLLHTFLASECKRLACHNYRKDPYAERASALFDELIRCGAQFRPSDKDSIYGNIHHSNSYIIDRLVALDKTPSVCALYDFHIFYKYSFCAGTTVHFARQFQSMPHNHLQNHLKGLLVAPLTQHFHFSNNYLEQLLVLFRYGADPTPFREELIAAASTLRENQREDYSKMLGNLTPEQHADHILFLWQTREQNPVYKQWPDKVAAAQAEIDQLKEQLQPHPAVTLPDQELYQKKWQALMQSTTKDREGMILSAFQQPLSLDSARDDEETVFRVLQRYYRRPTGSGILNLLYCAPTPPVWKSLHSCSHVLRARNNVLWYMELLENHALTHFNNEEKELLALAAIYHDSAAEEVRKDDEERQSAHYFRRDLQGHFTDELLNNVCIALESKEDDIHKKNEDHLNERVRAYLRVIRFGDRMDFIRCSIVPTDFPDWERNYQGALVFSENLLDLPAEARASFTTDASEKPPFQKALEAAMHGAVDLASLTGGHYEDRRKKGEYASRHAFCPDNKRLQQAFEITPQPLARMDQMIDDNVRRVIARLAGIGSCNSIDHQTCQSDIKAGVTRGIHNSWHDLQQVQIPACMSRLEKMQCEHDISLLSHETAHKIGEEITRLQQTGLLMNLGTLTQKTLKSTAVRQVLDKRGLAVVSEQRQRGYDESGNPVWQEMLVPVKKTSVVEPMGDSEQSPVEKMECDPATPNRHHYIMV